MPDRIQSLVEWLERAELGRDGRIPPERELADQFGLSRAELRKGLAVLEQQGLIHRHVGRGTFLTRPRSGNRLAPPPRPPVPPPSPEPTAPPDPSRPSPGSILSEPPSGPPRASFEPPGRPEREPASAEASRAEIAVARLALEPRLAVLAALHSSPADLAAIRAAQAEVLRAGGRTVAIRADQSFHRRIAEASRNRALIQLWEVLAGLRDGTPPGAPKGLAAEDPEQAARDAAEEHGRIVEAIARGDRDGAEEASREHVLREDGALFGPPF